MKVFAELFSKSDPRPYYLLASSIATATLIRFVSILLETVHVTCPIFMFDFAEGIHEWALQSIKILINPIQTTIRIDNHGHI